MKILNIVGARPNFIKIAPIMEQMLRSNKITPVLVHTGQHYDDNMSRVFFEQLEISKPEINLGVGSGTNSRQVGEVISRFEPLILKEKPDAVLVVGDVNSTIACSMVAAYHCVPIIHVEAGLRSFDPTMPEEINRILTDRLSDLLFVTEKSGMKNLDREGINPNKIYFVGNVMVDTLIKYKATAEKNSKKLDVLKLKPKQYVLMTLHRPSNVDFPDTLKSILESVRILADEIPVVFSIHPRTEKKIRDYALGDLLKPLTLLPPQPYLDMLKLMTHARMVLTDSGGIQEETTILEIPCLTFRESTERPVTLEQGTNTLVGTQTREILKCAKDILNSGGKKGASPDFWDGKAAERITKVLLDRFS